MCNDDIRREYTPHRSPNDCWALVLSIVSGKSYEDIYSEMIQRGFADETGLNSNHINSILNSYGYYSIYLPYTYSYADKNTYPIVIRIKDILREFYFDEIVIGSMNLERGIPHLSYAHMGVEHTTSSKDESLDDPVFDVWLKTQILHTLI